GWQVTRGPPGKPADAATPRCRKNYPCRLHDSTKPPRLLNYRVRYARSCWVMVRELAEVCMFGIWKQMTPGTGFSFIWASYFGLPRHLTPKTIWKRAKIMSTCSNKTA